ncbi:MAG: DEAD/DEAH box helicase family protein [Nitrososphaerota archaeon]|nr:DEAD/DEAH box helicase family protein [Nitrososphaerota archaeon]
MQGRRRYVQHPLAYSNLIEERLYQTGIAREASTKNTLVILPTALGKTVISALVAVDLLYSFRRSRILVMAPTRPLVMQHKRSFEAMIRLPAENFVLLTGKTPAGYREEAWSGASRLIFATPQVVRNDLLQGRADLSGFGLVVFDECHRAVKEYAYTEVAGSYAKSSACPLILGMTASPGSDIDRIMSVCRSLSIKHVEYRSEDDEDVRPYINPIKIEWKTVALPPLYTPVKDILKGMLDARIRSLRARGLLERESAFVSRRDLIELGYELRYRAELSIEEERGPIYVSISLQSQALTLFHMLELLDTQGADTLERFMERMEQDEKRSHSAILGDGGYRSLRELLTGRCGVEHPKVEALRLTVSGQLRSTPGSRVLVFTQYRDTASHLVEELNKAEGVRAERFVGQASRLNDPGLTQERQASLIEDLRKGHVNVLCATSIAEEGLDIPEVDLVVFYEPIPSEIRYIQRRGRTGRKAAGRVVILVAENTNDMFYLRASERRAQRMKEVVSTLNRKFEAHGAVNRTRPAPDPMAAEDIFRLADSPPETMVPPMVAAKEDMRNFDRLVGRAERALYMRILESGNMDEESLLSEMEQEGHPRSISRAALKKLAGSSYVSRKEGRAALQVKDIPGARVMKLEVEKVRQGEALVIVDGRWHARLESGNYDGPRGLIRKNSKFTALCVLDDSSGALQVRVRQVVGVDG